eukprot:symbB.v1.2.028024.t1/scaffold2924.1/size67115/7
MGNPGDVAAYAGTLAVSVKLPKAAERDTLQLVPNDSPSKELASEVADCVVNPLQAQYTWDSLTTLIESCRRLRQKNQEAMAEFPKRGPFWEEMPKGSVPASRSTVTGA